MRLSLSRFRKIIEDIPDPFESYAVKLAYLTGARANELCSISHESYNLERIGKRGKTIGFTRALGPRLSDVTIDSYKGVRILLIEMKVLKRKEKDQFVRTVGLPSSRLIDPWVVDLEDYFGKLINGEENETPLLNLDAWHLNKIIKKHGFYELCKSDKGRPEGDLRRVENPLRHFRRMHLKTFYHLDPEERTAFIGSKLSNIRGASAAEDEYMSLSWTDWIEKLLKPVPRELEVIA